MERDATAETEQSTEQKDKQQLEVKFRSGTPATQSVNRSRNSSPGVAHKSRQQQRSDENSGADDDEDDDDEADDDDDEEEDDEDAPDSEVSLKLFDLS